ncbi:MAG: archaea-specific SMC-related protein [Halobacteriaceae archaeon]
MWEIDIENVAGIRSGRATLQPGLNVVQASNWQGKSSFLAGIETAMGTATALTDGAERGAVTVDGDGMAVSVTLEREHGRVVRTGDPYLVDEQDRAYADLFAFLSEDNPVRSAVRRGDNLEDVLTRPLDFENIDEQIAAYRREREQVESELREAERARDRLPALQERVTGLESDLDDLRETRAALDDETDEHEELTAVRDSLSDARAQRDQLRSRIGRLESNVESAEDELAAKREALADVEVPETEDYEEQIEEARTELDRVERQIDVLTDVYNANSRVLDEDLLDLLTDVERGLMEDTLTCWVCGETADRDAFESRLAAIDDATQDLRAEAGDLRSQIESLEADREARETAQRREAALEEEISDLKQRRDEYTAELERSRDRLAELEDEIAALEDEMASLEADVDETESEITEVESEIKYTESELEDARADLEAAEETAAEVDALEERRESLAEQITELRTRKDRLKQDAREAFDDAMAEVLPVFEPGFEHARLTSQFDLVVVRDGREVSIDVLSEGEVELLGFVAALAGHEAFDVRERVPVILLDELGGLATEHLHHLVDYFRDRSPYVVTTAYPEAGDFDAHVVSPDGWEVVSDDVERVA